MATEWIPDKQIKFWIAQYGGTIRERSALSLYEASEFWMDKRWWRLGITIDKDSILFDPEILTYSLKDQAWKIYHELVHEAQYRDYGWLGFVGTYLGQWIRSGCKYDNMKKIGLEKEAIEKAWEFYDRIG